MKRSSYTTEWKLRAIELAKANGNRKAAKELNVDESMIRRWRKQEDVLRQTKKTCKSLRGNTPRWPELEDNLKHWVLEMQSVGRSISTVSIRLKAKALAKEMGITNFSGAQSWCTRFMKRNYLSIRCKTTLSQRRPSDFEEKASTFRQFCLMKIEEKNIDHNCIVNMDEVPVPFDMPPNRTIEQVGANSVPIITTGNEKTSCTVVLACSSSGLKLPPMVIFKRKTLPKGNFPDGVVVKANEKGWMDENLMRAWINEVFIKRPGGFFHTSSSMLICNSMRAHLTETVKSLVRRANTVLTVIPGGLTKILQPLDISVNRSFKAKLRKSWEEWMISGNHTFTKTGKQRRVDYVTIIEWILEAWNTIPTSTIINGFIKAGIINSSGVQGEVEEENEVPVVDSDELTDINSECDENYDEFSEN